VTAIFSAFFNTPLKVTVLKKGAQEAESGNILGKSEI